MRLGYPPGGASADNPLSAWLLRCSINMHSGLAMLKTIGCCG